jgi:hypothetical protein
MALSSLERDTNIIPRRCLGELMLCIEAGLVSLSVCVYMYLY